VVTDGHETSVDGTSADVTAAGSGAAVVVTNVFEAPVGTPADTQGARAWLATTGARTAGAVGLAVLPLLVGSSWSPSAGETGRAPDRPDGAQVLPCP